MPNNYCHENCEHSLLPRDSNGVLQGRNLKLQCALGYVHTVNSIKARSNSEKNGAVICPKLRNRFRDKEVI